MVRRASDATLYFHRESGIADEDSYFINNTEIVVPFIQG